MFDLLKYPEHVLNSYKSTLELVMVTQKNTDEEELLERTFHFLSKYQKVIDEETEKRKRIAEVTAIEDTIQGFIFSEERERRFINKSTATVSMDSGLPSSDDSTLKSSKLSIFLFNDILLLTKKNKQRLNAIREGGKQTYKFIREIKLYRTSIDKCTCCSYVHRFLIF